jgi:ribosome-associated protein
VEIITLNDKISIPVSELEIRFSRSGGPGGQHVNKTSTQTELTFDLVNSPSIPEEEREWLIEKLKHRLDSSGRLRFTSQDTRSQRQNKAIVLERFEEVLRHALRRPKKRRPTKPSKAAVQRRIEAKKKRSETKSQRRAQF